jgi:hypothetical protein
VGDLPVYFSNLEAEIANGTNIDVGVVTEADITAAEQQLASDINRVVAEDWTANLPAGQAILIPSVDAGDPDTTVVQQVGDLSEVVTVQGTASATGFQYDEGVVQQQALEFYSSALNEQVPDGYELLAGSVVLGEPNLVAQSTSSVEFRMEAAATVRAEFKAEDRDRVIADIAGSDEAEAEAILANEPAFVSWQIERSPGWWPGGLPRATSRISLEAAGEGGVESEASPAAEGGES